MFCLLSYLSPLKCNPYAGEVFFFFFFNPYVFFLKLLLEYSRHYSVVLLVKKLPANAGDIRDMGLILGQEDPLEEGTETHSSILA